MNKRKLHHWLIGMASGVLLLGQVLLAPSCFAQMVEALSDEELDGVSAGGLELVLEVLQTDLVQQALSAAQSSGAPFGSTTLPTNNGQTPLSSSGPLAVNTNGGAFGSIALSGNAQSGLQALVNFNAVNSIPVVLLNFNIFIDSTADKVNNLNQVFLRVSDFL